MQVTYEWVVGETLDKDYQCFVHAVNPDAGSKPDCIAFQQDHGLPKPTSQWHAGDVIVDGPYEITVSDQCDEYDLTIGLFRGERLRLQGLRDASDRVVVARLNLKHEAGKIVDISATQPTSPLLPSSVPEADFTAHLNAEGSWIDFGPVATDGSLKINKQSDRLVVFPYPRDRAFRAVLDLRQLAPAAKLDRIEVRKLAPGDQHDLGAAEFSLDGRHLQISFTPPGVGRYVVAWE